MNEPSQNLSAPSGENQPSDKNQRSDKSLIAEFQSTGSMEAFQQLHDRHEPTVRRVGNRILRDHALSKDVAQETFLTIFQKAESYSGVGDFRSWLLQIARRLSLNYLRKVGREETGIADGLTSPQTIDADADLCAQVTECLNLIPDQLQQIALKLHYIDGYSYAEIASQLGIPLGNVKSHIQNGRRMFAKIWKVRSNGMGRHRE